MKFLRGKALQVILAVCMLMMLLCITASAAESAVAGAGIGGSVRTVTKGGDPLYFKTDSAGNVSLCDEADHTSCTDHTIEFVYPSGASTPELHLRGAYINSAIYSSSSYPTDLTIVVHDGYSPVTVNAGTVDADSYMTQKITWRHGNLVIQGDGKFKMNVAGNCFRTDGHVLTFKDLNVEITTDLASTVVFADDNDGVVDGIVFDNCTASVESKQYAITVGINSIQVINGANVTMTSNNTTLYCDTTGAKLEVDSSTLNVTTSNGTPLRWKSATTDNGGIFVKNGTLELLGTTKAMQTNYPSILTNYKNADDINADYAVVVGSKASDAAAYDNTTDLVNYKYFKIEPTYTIAVEKGTASVGGETATKATANTTVTLTAAPAEGNQAFAGWEVVSGPNGFTFDTTQSPTTFKMPAGNVSVKATYGNAATVKIGGTNFTAVEGNAAQYFQTDNAGGVTKAGGENTYNIKFEYPTDGTPTISLRDAYITSTGTYAIQSVSNSADKVIIVVEKTETPSIEVGAGNYVETDSYLGKGISWSHGALEIQGSETAQAIENIGKLMVKSTIAMTLQPITFKNLNLEMVTTSSTQLFNGTPTLITFDGGKAVLETGYVVYFVTSSDAALEGIKVTGNADVSMLSGDMTIYAPGGNTKKILVESGKLSAKTTNSSKYVMQFADTSNRIVVKSGTVEFATPSANTIGGQVPVLTDYLNASGEKNYRAVYSTTTNTPTEQDLVTYTSGGLSYKYFKLEPAYKVTVDGEVVHAKVTVDTPVTITAATVAGQEFTNWTVTGITLSESQLTQNSVTFNMPAGNVSATASYIKVANIILSGVTHTFKANQTIPLKTTVDGAITSEGASESDYNIMLAFDGETGIPTVYLKGAYIKADNTAIQNGANTPEFAIKTEKAESQMTADGELVDSYIIHANATSSTGNAVLTSGKVIFYGEGLLKTKGISSAAKSIVSSSGRTQPIEFQNANVKIYGNGSGYGNGAITGSASKVIFNGGTVYIKSTYAPIFEVAVDVTGGADVDLISTSVQPLYSPSYPVTIDGGSLYVKGSVNEIIDVSALNIKSGDMEAVTTTGVVSPDTPDFAEYENWYAVMGASKETATKYESGALSGKYFRVGKKATVTVTKGTAQAFGVQSTENAGIHTLETMVGAEVTVTANSADPGWAFAGWVDVTGLDNIDLNDDSIVFLMPAGDVSATATHGRAAEVKIGGTAYVAVEGGQKHFLITSGGNVMGGGTEGAYNIRFEYLKDGTPTIYLRDAYINSGSYAIQSVATAADKVIIVVEKVATPSEKNGEVVDSYLGKGIYWSHGALEIQGQVQNSVWSKLKMTAGIYMNAQEITFKNLDLNIDMTGSIFTGTPALITFDGGKAVLTASRPVYWPTTDDVVKGFVINDADVTMSSSDLTIYAPECVNAKIVVNNGKLTATTDAAKAVMQFKNVNNSLVLNGGTVEFSTPYSDGIGYIVPTLTYDETNGKTYYASVSTNQAGTGAFEYNGTSGLGNYKYFKVRPGYWITVDGGTPNKLRAPANETFTVNLTPGNAPNAGEGFKYWTSSAWAEGVKVQGSSYKFTMPNEPITIVANWGDLAQVQMNANTTVSVVEGGATHYYTVADNTIAAGNEGNYNIMFAYAEGGTPTLTLKGVTLTSGGRIHCGADTPELIVMVQGENTIHSGNLYTVSFTGNNLTFEGIYDAEAGIYGTISLTSGTDTIYMDGTTWDAEKSHALSLENVNMEITTGGIGGIRLTKSYNLNVSGGSLTIRNNNANGYAGIYNDNSGTAMTINNDAVIRIPVAGDPAIRVGSLTMDSGVLVIGTNDTKVKVGVYSNTWVINGGTVEVFASGNVSGIAPNLAGYVDEESKPKYVAVAAESRDEFEANPSNYTYNVGTALSGTQYFLVEPKHVEVTISWGAMTFNYTGSVWDVDTLTWVGNWEPSGTGKTQVDMQWDATNQQWVNTTTTDAESDEMAANQIKVENTGTETVYVTFGFNTTNSTLQAPSTVGGKFMSSADAANAAELADGHELVRFGELDAYLNLNSGAVASFPSGTILGTVTVTIDAIRPAQGGNA